MSFQAYLDNIEAKTGQSPDDFPKLADRKGFTKSGKLKPGVKTGAVMAWLTSDYALGHGHAMAIVALLKGSKEPYNESRESELTRRLPTTRQTLSSGGKRRWNRLIGSDSA